MFENTTTIGGAALLAGACATNTTTISGASNLTGTCRVTPQNNPGDGNWWSCTATAANVLTVKVCAAVAGTPSRQLYNVQYIQ